MNDMTEALAQHIGRKSGHPGVLSLLADQLKPTDLQSLMLSVYDLRSKRLSAGDILRRAMQQPLVLPSTLDLRRALSLDRLILDVIDPGFEAVELSPLGPFGLNAAVASTSQKKIVSTVRNNEVVSDLSTALALDACYRRMNSRGATPGRIRLCTSHRTVRAQAYPKHLGFTPHFRVFGMLSADNSENPNHRFIRTTLAEHVLQYLRVFKSACSAGYLIKGLVVTVSDVSITEALIERQGVDRRAVSRQTLSGDGTLFGDEAPFPHVVADLAQVDDQVRREYDIVLQVKRLTLLQDSLRQEVLPEFPDVQLRFMLDRIGGIGHYKDVCFKIDGTNATGRSFPLVDGGTTDWMAKLLANAHERCMVSAVGTEIFCREYLEPPVPSP